MVQNKMNSNLMNNSSIKEIKYQYDGNGNVLYKEEGDKDDNTLKYSYVYNEIDQLMNIHQTDKEAQTFNYDDNGRLTNDNLGNSYHYNALDQLMTKDEVNYSYLVPDRK